jgi:hypothetical protein
MRFGCTTCDAGDYRTAVRALAESLAIELGRIDLHALQTVPEWRDGVRTAMVEVPLTQREAIFKAWLPQVRSNIAVADWVLFYCIRPGILFTGMSKETRAEWVRACVELAVDTHDESLVESLIYTLHGKQHENQELREVIAAVEETSPRVRMAKQRQDMVVREGGQPRAERPRSAQLRPDHVGWRCSYPGVGTYALCLSCGDKRPIAGETRGGSQPLLLEHIVPEGQTCHSCKTTIVGSMLYPPQDRYRR